MISSNELLTDQDLPKIERCLAERSLAEFVRQAWHVIEPSTPLVWGWHLDAICQHLEAVSEGRLRNLIIEVPPRSSKSSVVSVLWPVWEWISRPSTRFLTASYALNLAIRDALRSRRVILSPWYQERWRWRFALVGDQNVKSRYENNRTGYRISLSARSGTTGEGGGILLIDDAHSVTEAESEARRLATILWHDEAFFNRVNNALTGARVVVGQRVAHRDLIGHLKQTDDYEVLCIPEEFEPDRRCRTSLGWQDPRTEAGELLRPERFGPEQVAEAKRRLGSVAYAAQHQQRPTPREGAIFQAAWLDRSRFTIQGGAFLVNGRIYPPTDCWWFGTADPAGGESEHADYSALAVWAVTPARHLLLVHVDRVRLPIEKIVPHWQMVLDGFPLSYLAIESCFLANTLVVKGAKRMPGLPPIRGVTPRGKDKFIRAIPAVVAVEAGQVFFRQPAPWWEDFKLELLRFTGKNDEHDDLVDCLSYSIAEWERMGEGMDELPASGSAFGRDSGALAGMERLPGQWKRPGG